MTAPIADRVFSAVRSGAATNREIQIAVNGAVAPNGYSQRIDRALQSLRRQGLIEAKGGRWRMTVVTRRPTCGQEVPR